MPPDGHDRRESRGQDPPPLVPVSAAAVTLLLPCFSLLVGENRPKALSGGCVSSVALSHPRHAAAGCDTHICNTTVHGGQTFHLYTVDFPWGLRFTSPRSVGFWGNIRKQEGPD